MLVITNKEDPRMFEGITVSSNDIVEMTGLSYRQLDNGIRRGLEMDSEPVGSGRYRTYTFADAVRCAVFAVLVKLCPTLEEPIELANSKWQHESINLSRTPFDGTFVNVYMIRASVRAFFAAIEEDQNDE